MRDDRTFGRSLLRLLLHEQQHDTTAAQPRQMGRLLTTSLRLERDALTERATLHEILARMDALDDAEPRLTGYAGRVGKLVRLLPDFGETVAERRMWLRYRNGHFVCEKAVPATYYGEPAILLDVRFGDGRTTSVYEREVEWCEPERPPDGGDAA